MALQPPYCSKWWLVFESNPVKSWSQKHQTSHATCNKPCLSNGSSSLTKFPIWFCFSKHQVTKVSQFRLKFLASSAQFTLESLRCQLSSASTWSAWTRLPSLKETTKVTKLKNVQTSLKPPFETAQPLKTKKEFKDVLPITVWSFYANCIPLPWYHLHLRA